MSEFDMIKQNYILGYEMEIIKSSYSYSKCKQNPTKHLIYRHHLYVLSGSEHQTGVSSIYY